MSKPNTGYDIFTVTNPSAPLTDFVLLVDLSNCSADFKAAWNTNLNGYGRCYKGDGVTELACDWTALNYSAGTGFVRIKWSGSLSSSGVQKIQLFPPNTENSQYASGDTYGSYAAWSDAIAAYTFDSGPGEQSGNGNDLAVTGAVNEPCKLANGYTFDGSDSLMETGGYLNPTSLQSGFTVLAWVNRTGGGSPYIVGKDDAVTAQDGFYIRYSDGNQYLVSRVDGGATPVSAVGSIPIGWSHIAVTFSAAGLITHYVNGSLSGTPASSNALSAITTTSVLSIGNASHSSAYGFIGCIDDVRVIPSVLSAEWIAEEYAQANDNSTFIGSPVWVNSVSLYTPKSPRGYGYAKRY